jgi:hypothetical protein
MRAGSISDGGYDEQRDVSLEPVSSGCREIAAAAAIRL